MRRALFMLALTAMFGAGIFVGSLTTPSARADKPTVVQQPAQYTTPDGVYSPSYQSPGNGGYFPIVIRWQILTVPSPRAGTGALIILVDTQNGDTFYLNYDNRVNTYTWSRLIR